jgi:hypothetical protein
MILYHSCNCDLIKCIQKSVTQLVGYSNQVYVWGIFKNGRGYFYLFQIGQFFQGRATVDCIY